MRTAVTLLWIALTPAAVAGSAVLVAKALRDVRRRLAPARPQPAGPPLEQVAADLRRLMAEHETVCHSPRLPAKGRRLIALRGAITDRAVEAARAVGVDPPERTDRAALPVEPLRSLLLELVRSGVVLPGAERFGR